MPKLDPQKFLPLKTNWFHILLSLAGEEQHGYGIMQEVLDRTGGQVRLWPASLYGSLKRLIEAGLIEESAERPAPELDDARRRYYKLTALGRHVLDAESARLTELVRVIQLKRGFEVNS
jgi:DNA-binding PadR family transcriptional regulator